MLEKLNKFTSTLQDKTFGEEFNKLKRLVAVEYKIDIGNSLSEIGRLMANIQEGISEQWFPTDKRYMKVKITMDSDFDGFASAKGMYHLFRLLGIPEERIEIISLSSLHTSDILEVTNTLLVVTDTSYGNVRYSGTSNKVLWVDHHLIRIVDYLKAKDETRGQGVFINSSKSLHSELRGLSCGTFIFVLINVLIERMGLSPDNQFQIKSKFNEVTQLDCIMSMISDEMSIEDYPGLMKGIYEAHKPEFYESFKNKYTYNNQSYFRKYIAKVNNLIRMERTDLIESIIKDRVDHALVTEVTRMDTDKKQLMDMYFHTCPVEHDYSTNDVSLCIYQVPLSQSSIMRNFKGLLASMKIPSQGKYIVFSYYENNAEGKAYFSCRHNTDLDIKRHLLQHSTPIAIGGHDVAFGLTADKSEINSIFKAIKMIADIEIGYMSMEGKVIDYLDLGTGIGDLSRIAMYNEFSTKPLRVAFSKEDFSDVRIEGRRTVYYLPITNKEPLQVVSFDLEIKPNIICIPKLKKSLYDVDNLDILEL